MQGTYRRYTLSGKLVSQRKFGYETAGGNLPGTAFRLAKAAIKGQKIVASFSEISRRLEICGGCEFFVESPRMRCQKCGCYLNLKSRLETEHCPIGKW
jgi:hypothetical protein